MFDTKTALEQFNALSDVAKKRLSSALDSIEHGISPNIDAIHDLSLSLSDLRSAYEKAKDAAIHNASADGVNDIDAAFCSYIETIDENERRQLIAALQPIISLLERFVRVKSDKDAFMGDLIPIQSEASDLLNSLKNDPLSLNQGESGLNDNVVRPKQLFMEALHHEDMTDDRGIELSEDLAGFFPSRIIYGLIAGVYYEPHNPNPAKQPEPQAAVLQVKNDSVLPGSEVKGEALSSIEENGGCAEIESAPLVPQRPSLGKKKLGIKKLQSDVLSAGYIARFTFSLLASWPGLTSVQIARVASSFYEWATVPEAVQTIIDRLVKKTYLESVAVNDDTHYFLTAPAAALCSKETVYNYKNACRKSPWLIPMPESRISKGIRNIDTTAERIKDIKSRDIEEVLRSYDLLIDYLCYVEDSNPGVNKSKLLDSLFGSTPSAVLIYFNDQLINCVLAPEGERLSLEGRNVLSDVAPKENVECADIDHWFILKGGSLEDAFAKLESVDEVDEDDTLLPSSSESLESDQSPADFAVDSEAVILNEEHDCDCKNLASSDDSNEAEGAVVDSCAQEAERENPDISIHPDITDEIDSNRIASILAERKMSPSDDEARLFVSKLFDEQNGIQSLVAAHYFLKALSAEGDRPWAQLASLQMAYGCDSKIERHLYRGSELKSAFPTISADTSALQLAAYCRAMVAPAVAYDYELHATAETFGKNFDELFPQFVVLKPLFNELLKIWDVSPERGLDSQVVEMLGGEERRDQAIAETESKARLLCAPPKVKAMIKGIPEFLESSFGDSSDFGSALTMVANDERESRPLIEDVLAQFKVDSSDAEQDKAISEFIDLKWRMAVNGKKNRGMNLEYAARKHLVGAIEDRIEVLKEWNTLIGSSFKEGALEQLGKLKDRILVLTDEVSVSGATFNPVDSIVLNALFADIKRLLAGNSSCTMDYEQFLVTGCISIDSGLPVLNMDLSHVVYCEPWRVLLEHHLSPKLDLAEAARLIADPSARLFDNLGQLDNILNRCGAIEGVLPPSDLDRKNAHQSALDELDKYKDMLEMAYAYNKIDEQQKERLLEIARLNMGFFFDLEDYANWKRFLKGLQKQVDDLSLSRKTDLDRRLSSCRCKLQGKKSSLLDKATALFEEGNYAVVEEYLNRIDAGKLDLDVTPITESDVFSEFISDDVYKQLFDCCKKSNNRNDFAKFAKSYINKNAPKSWDTDYKDSGYKENALKMVGSWPKRGNKTGGADCQDIATFLRALGLSVRQVDRTSQGQARYSASLRPASRGMTQYSHPIAAFGTKMPSKLDVLLLFGSLSPRDILSKVRAAGLTRMSLVFVDSPMRLEDKRALAELSHASNNHLQFIVIDQVLALFLALHEEPERLQLMLKCALPFTFYQPFVRDGGPTPDEMFCGRDAELRSIMDPGGAIIVYGGRQLGKTALLQRAESLCQKPDSKEFAVYVNILNCRTEKDVACKVAEAFGAKADLSLGKVEDIRSLAAAIAKAMNSKLASRVLLLLDECDNFLNAIAEHHYRELQPLIDLKSESTNSFKFVIAGLHNVCRAKNAIQENGFSGQVGSPICVKPLSPQEALQLISRPLLYLGFQVDRYPHLETILTNTNYYPGIIQFFGHTLVETMKEQYGVYYRAADGQPPYPLLEEQLGEIINKNDLNNSIREKFRLSLELDERYFMLARCIAMLSFAAEREDDQKSLLDGFSIGAIQKSAIEFDISCLKCESQSALETLLDEMVEMGILTKPSMTVHCYKLRRHSFLNIIGANEDAVFDDIIEANECAKA